VATFERRPASWDEFVDIIIASRRLVIDCFKDLNLGLSDYIRNREPVDVSLTLANDSWQKLLALKANYPHFPQSAVDPWGFAGETDSKSKNDSHNKNQTKFIPSSIALKEHQPYLDAQQKYFSNLNAFIHQLNNVMVVNFQLSKLPNGAEKEAKAALLSEKGIRIDTAHLATHNLWDFKCQLETFQTEFRYIFSDMPIDSLEDLEQSEQYVISETWLLWHHYAHKPTARFPSPIQSLAHNLTNKKRKLDKQIRRVLSKFKNAQRSAKQLNVDLKWSGSTALAIQLDITAAISLYEEFKSLVTELHAQFHSIRCEDLQHYLFREHYEMIIIIPTISGKLVNQNAWVLYSLCTVLNEQPIEEHNWVSYLMQPLPEAWISEIKLPQWKIQQINQANKISEAVSGLMILTSQIAELNSFPKDANVKSDIIAGHLQERSELISTQLVQFMDCTSAVLDCWSELSDVEKKKRPNLTESVTALVELYATILPSNKRDGTETYFLNLEDLSDYAKKLTDVWGIAESIRLHLIDDWVESSGSTSSS